MSFAVLNKRNGYTDLGDVQQPRASAAVTSDLVGQIVANANAIIARGLVSQNRLRFLPSHLQSMAATQPLQAFIRLVTPAGPFMAEVVSEANAMSGKLTRRVGPQTIKMAVAQRGDAGMDPIIKSVVIPLRLLVQFTTLRMQDPALLMSAMGKVLVRQGLWPFERFKSFIQQIPNPSSGVNALKTFIQQRGPAALDPGQVLRGAIDAGKDVLNRLTHIVGLSGLGEGDDMSFEEPQPFTTDPLPSADQVGPPIPEQPVADSPPTAPGSAGDAPLTDGAVPPPVKDVGGGTKATAGAIPQIIATITQLLHFGVVVQKGTAQAQNLVQQLTGRGRGGGGQPAAKQPDTSIIPGVPDVALLAGGALAAYLLTKK